MRLLWLSFLVFPPAVVFGSAMDDVSDDQMQLSMNLRKLRYEWVYDQLRDHMAQKLKQESKWSEFHGLPDESFRAYFEVLKTLIPHSSHPTPEKLQQLADDTFEAGKQFYEDYRQQNVKVMITQLAYNFSINTAILKSECPGGSESDCEYKMAHALETAGSSEEKEYLRSIALESRCYLEKWKKYSKKTFTLDMIPSIIGNDLWLCYAGAKIDTRYLEPVISFEADEVIEFVQSRKNLEAFIKTFNIFMEAVKNPKSYESIESFAEKIKNDRILKAVTQFISELRRCAVEVEPELMKRVNKAFISYFNVSKVVFANAEDPTEDMVKDAISEALLRHQELVTYIEKIPPEEVVLSKLKHRKCFLPESASEQVLQLEPVFDANRADEDKHLLKVANISKTLESVVQISYEYLHHLRNRVEWTDETRNFFAKVLRSTYVFAGADGTTEEGKEAQEEVLKELRESVIELSHDAKKMFADHFLFETVVLLACIF